MSRPLDRIASALSSRYRLERELGQGGMATVYLAHDLKHDRKVALKVLRPELVAVLGAERFLQEIMVTANLQHPHILPLFDSGNAEGLLFYVMPYVQGESLRDRLGHDDPIPLRGAMRILRDIVDAMAAAHARGIVHRDIKPDNVMLSGRHALVTDFGVAKAVSEATGGRALTATGLAIGTPSYMAPEQAVADPKVDHRADIYAFGALAYELLTGRPPFTAASLHGVLAAHVTQSPVQITELAADVPRPLAAVIMKCLEKEPADRWQTAEELLAGLETAIHAEGAGTPVDLPGTSTPRADGSRSTMWTAVIGVLLVSLLAGGWWLTRGSVPQRDRIERIAVLPPSSPAVPPDGDVFADGMTSELISVLSRMGGASVIGTRSVMRYKNADRGLQEIGRELGVDALVTLSVLQAGDQVRIGAELIDAVTEETLWAGSYTRSSIDVIALQNEVARAIVQELEPELAPDQTAALANAPRVDRAAYNAYLLGKMHLYRLTPEDLRVAIEHFQRATSIDSSFADAWAWLAVGYATGVYFGLPVSATASRAITTARRALALDARNGMAHTALGFVHFFQFDHRDAEREFQRALRVEPNSLTYMFYAFHLSALGRHDEAIAAAERAVFLDPGTAAVHSDLGWRYADAGLWDRAIAQAEFAIAMDSTFAEAWQLQGSVHTVNRDYEAALAALGKAEETGGANAWVRGIRGYIYGATGRVDDARHLLRELEILRAGDRASWRDLATVHAGLGNIDSAVTLIHRAVEDGEWEVRYLLANYRIAPHDDALRADPRIHALRSRLGFEP